MQPLCETRAICKDFVQPEKPPLHVLENIDLQIFPGEILAIIGPSGCGKSTLLRILAGLIPATKGGVYFQEKRVHGLLPHFAFVFQSFALYPWLNVAKNIEIALEALNLPEAEVQKRTADAIAMIGLAGFEEAYPREISGGMKQRVGLARALVCHPQLLLLDEPFSSLDTFTAEMLREELLEIWAQKKNGLSSIVLVSHDVREVAFLADRIAMMDANPGRIRFIKENKLPRPREYHAEPMLQLVDALHDAYAQGADSLQFAEPEEITSFLSYVARHSHKNNLEQIAHLSHVLAREKGAEILQFVAVDKQTATVTSVGKKYLAASHRERRGIWREQLLAIPLFVAMVQALQRAPKQTMSRKELLELVAKTVPHDNAEAQAKILLNWGTHGDLIVRGNGNIRLM